MREVPSQGELPQLGLHRRALAQVRTAEQLKRWCTSVLDAGGGRLRDGASNAPDVEQHPPVRSPAADEIATWQPVMATVLARLRHRGELESGTDTDALATAVVATIGGGYLLAGAARSDGPLQVALDLVLTHLARHAEPGPPAGSQR